MYQAVECISLCDSKLVEHTDSWASGWWVSDRSAPGASTNGSLFQKGVKIRTAAGALAFTHPCELSLCTKELQAPSLPTRFRLVHIRCRPVIGMRVFACLQWLPTRAANAGRRKRRVALRACCLRGRLLLEPRRESRRPPPTGVCRSVPAPLRECVSGKHLRIVLANILLQAIAPYLGGPFDLESLWAPFLDRCVARGASTVDHRSNDQSRSASLRGACACVPSDGVTGCAAPGCRLPRLDCR